MRYCSENTRLMAVGLVFGKFTLFSPFTLGFGENSRVLDWICQRVDGTTHPIFQMTSTKSIKESRDRRTDQPTEAFIFTSDVKLLFCFQAHQCSFVGRSAFEEIYVLLFFRQGRGNRVFDWSHPQGWIHRHGRSEGVGRLGRPLQHPQGILG